MTWAGSQSMGSRQVTGIFWNPVNTFVHQCYIQNPGFQNLFLSTQGISSTALLEVVGMTIRILHICSLLLSLASAGRYWFLETDTIFLI